MEHVVIIAMGRSGSTLLQGVLNSIPGYCIRGENCGLLLNLYQGLRSILLAKLAAHAEVTDPTNPLYGAELLNEELYVSSVRRMVVEQLAPPHGTKVLGFKEVRWTSIDLRGADLWNFLRFIQRVLPGVKFLLLTRRIEELLQSGWWKERIPQESADLANSMYTLVRSAPIDYFEIDYRSVVEGSQDARRMFEYLGEKFDAEAYAQVIGRRHSFY